MSLGGENVSMPMTFTINDTDFKIDEAKSRYSLNVLESGDAVIRSINCRIASEILSCSACPSTYQRGASLTE